MASNASEGAAGDAGAAGVAKRRPLIGLTTYRERAQTLVWDTEFALLHHAYVDALARAGGVPVLLPPQDHGADEVIERLRERRGPSPVRGARHGGGRRRGEPRGKPGSEPCRRMT